VQPVPGRAGLIAKVQTIVLGGQLGRETPHALHLVSAYATERGLVLGQRATEGKGGELAVIRDLLDGLDLRGCLV
jgi:hypothetical protein